MRDGRTEQRHDRVADDLVDLPAEGGDVGDEALEAAVDEVLHLLGVHRLRKAGEADQVGEQHGDDAALVARGRHEAVPARWGRTVRPPAAVVPHDGQTSYRSILR